MRHCRRDGCPHAEGAGADGFCAGHYVLAWLVALGLDPSEAKLRDESIRRGATA